MKTKRQEELVKSFLSIVDDGNRPLYQDLTLYLSELGYNPYKQRSYIVFKHDMHNKQIAKTGKRTNKGLSAFFALRFSACKGYSQKFADIVKEAIVKSPHRSAGCMEGNCDFCAGEANTHVYMHTFPDGECKTHCGASPLEITGITQHDIAEIKKLIKEEHIYLMKHQAGIIVS